MKTAVLQVRLDSKLKKEADSLFASAGFDTTTAVRLFLKQSVIRGRIPFDVVASPEKTPAKTSPSALHDPAVAYGTPVASEKAVRPPFRFGSMAGKVWMADDFDAPLEFGKGKKKLSLDEVFDCARGQFNIPDDFDAPLEDFKEYME